MKKIVIHLFIFLILVMPVLSSAWAPGDSLVPCTNTAVNGAIPSNQLCDFTAFLTLINNIINFILVYMAVPIAAIMFVYAGFELVTSGGSTEKRGTAKNVFTNAVIGLILAAAAWIIIKWILSIVAPGTFSWIGF
jgi:hypothetical protein